MEFSKRTLLLINMLIAVIIAENSTELESENITLSSLSDVTEICQDESCLSTTSGTTEQSVKEKPPEETSSESERPPLKERPPLTEKPVPSRVPPQVQHSWTNASPRDNYACPCDQHMNMCEMNCCCDPDCDVADTLAFSSCRHVIEDTTNYCLKNALLYRNNTHYKMVELSDHLFCVTSENLPNTLKFKNQKIITTTDNFKKVWKRKKTFMWSSIKKPDQPKLDTSVSYFSGSELLILYKKKNGYTVKHLEVPTVGATSFCQDKSKVLYLENKSTSCLVKIPLSKANCEADASLSATDVCAPLIVSSPNLLNMTNINASDIEIFKEFDVYTCLLDEDCTKISNVPKVKCNDKNYTCSNVLKRVHYVLKHNGTVGITEARCFLTLTDITLEEVYLRQTFDVTFEWAHASNSSFHRSGNPGYLRDKPVISAVKTTNLVDEVEKDSFSISADARKWISVVYPNHDGTCSNYGRNLLFDQNSKTQCVMWLSEDDIKTARSCSLVQQKVWEKLVGWKRNNSTGNLGWLSVWGRPRVQGPEDWVPLLLDTGSVPNLYVFGSSGCSAVASLLEVSIITSKVGPSYSPQTKLIAASATPKLSPIKCTSSNKCYVTVTSSVTFTDISESYLINYKRPPVISIHLPRDFFYPFSSCTFLHSNPNLIILLLILLSQYTTF